MTPAEQSIERLFAEPFEPTWMWREFARMEVQVREGVNAQWAAYAAETRIKLSMRPDAPMAEAPRKWSGKGLFRRHLVPESL